MSFNNAYEKSLTEGYFIDTAFYLNSKKTSPGKLFSPKSIYASSKLLKEASPYFSHSKSCVLLTNVTFPKATSISVLSGTFREGRYGNIDSGFLEDEPTFIEDYEYDSDSDLELDDSEDEDIPVPRVLNTSSDDSRTESPPPERWSTPVAEEMQAIPIPDPSTRRPPETYQRRIPVLPQRQKTHLNPATQLGSERSYCCYTGFCLQDVRVFLFCFCLFDELVH